MVDLNNIIVVQILRIRIPQESVHAESERKPSSENNQIIGIGWKVRLAFLPTLGQRDIWVEVSKSCQRLQLIGGYDTQLHAIFIKQTFCILLAILLGSPTQVPR